MKAHIPILLAFAGAVLLSTGPVAAQSKPGAAPVTPRAAQERPNDEGAKPKLVSPIRGEAQIEYTQPKAVREGNMVITKMKVKNVSSGPIAGFKVDEFWYDKGGQPVTGAMTFRHRKPFMPGEVIDVELRVPSVPTMDRNSYKFEHQNGTIKPTRVPKL